MYGLGKPPEVTDGVVLALGIASSIGELKGMVLVLFGTAISVNVDFYLSKRVEVVAWCGAPPRTE